MIQLIDFFRKRDLSMILHRQNQFLDSSTETSLTLYKKQSFKTKVVYQQFIGLVNPDRTGERNNKKSKGTCSNNINYDNCVYQTKEDMMRKATKQNCTVPFTQDNSKVCSESNDMEAALLIANRKLEKNRCLTPCRSLLINYGGRTMNTPPENTKKNTKKKGKNKNSAKQNNKSKGTKKKKSYKKGANSNAKLHFGTRVQKIEEHQLYKF